MKLFRVQDVDGRGPYKPGFSHHWKSDTGSDLPPFFIELGISPWRVPDLFPVGYAGGCACRSLDDLKRWFNRGELRRLRKLGYSIVEFEPDLIVAETATQVVFAMRRPLSLLRAAA